MEIVSHIELTRPISKRDYRWKSSWNAKGSSRASQAPFQSWPQYRIESVSRAPGSLKSHIYSSLFIPCRSTLSQETSKMKGSRNTQSIKQCLCGTGERSRNAGEMQWKGAFTMPKQDGLFANKGEGLDLPSFSSLSLWWIRPTGFFL